MLLLTSPCPPTSIANLFIEASIATLVTVVFDSIFKKVKSKKEFRFLLIGLVIVSFLYQYVYQFIVKKPPEESLAIFILILCSNLLSQFLTASFFNKLKYFEKFMMCISSICFFGGMAFSSYSFLVVSNYYAGFIGLAIFLISGFSLVKRYKAFIPL